MGCSGQGITAETDHEAQAPNGSKEDENILHLLSCQHCGMLLSTLDVFICASYTKKLVSDGLGSDLAHFGQDLWKSDRRML